MLDGRGNVGKFEFAMPPVTRKVWKQEGYIRPFYYASDAVVMSLMAGAVAKLEILGDVCGGDGGDKKLIESIIPDDREYKARLAGVTRMLVRRHRGRIEHLAKVLWERGTLSNEEIDREIGFVPRAR
jgi:hypothetical protein